MKTKNRLFWLFDNGRTTFDRFTIILSNGDVFGASENPFHPQGLGQYCGNWINSYFTITYGYSWRDHTNLSAYKLRQVLDNQLHEYRNKESEKEITDISLIPEKVMQFIKQSI